MTEPYKFLSDILENTSSVENRTDLSLGQVVYLSTMVLILVFDGVTVKMPLIYFGYETSNETLWIRIWKFSQKVVPVNQYFPPDREIVSFAKSSTRE